MTNREDLPQIYNRFLFFANIWLQNYSEAAFSVHFDDHRGFGADVAEKFSLFDSFDSVEIGFIEPAIALERIYREISHPEGSQVLEEMRTLAGVHAVVFESAFDDDARIADMRPFHRDSEPGVAASPTSRADEDVALAPLREFTVDAVDVVGYQLVIGRVEGLALDVNYVADVVHDAMPKDTCGREDGLLRTDLRQVFLHDFLVVHDGTNL